MTVPSTGNVSARQVNQDISLGNGAFNFRDTKNRDAIRKPSGSISLSDFRGLVYGQGRTGIQSQSAGETNVRPYHYDQRQEGEISDLENVSFSVLDNGGLPQWRCYARRKGFFPGSGNAALDNLGYFVKDKNSSHSLYSDVRKNIGFEGYYDACRLTFYALSFSAGYLSGSRVTDIQENSIGQAEAWYAYSRSWTPTHNHVVFIFASQFPTGWKVSQEVLIKNVRVTN